MAVAASSERSEYYVTAARRHCAKAPPLLPLLPQLATNRRAYALQYNVVTLRSEHIEYRSCPALH
jgi:hypothetical protein